MNLFVVIAVHLSLTIETMRYAPVSLFDQTHLILRTAIMLVDSFFIDASFSDIVSTDVKIDPRSMP